MEAAEGDLFISRPVSIKTIVEMGANPQVIALFSDAKGSNNWFPVNFGMHMPISFTFCSFLYFQNEINQKRGHR